MSSTSNRNTKLDVFFRAYIECALWSSYDQADESGGEPMNVNYTLSDIARDTLTEMREECHDFLFAHPEDPVTQFLQTLDNHTLEQAGYDFWLTRNGHGAGFWDGDWDRPWSEEDRGQRLTERAKPYGEVDLYVGDDGRIHS